MSEIAVSSENHVSYEYNSCWLVASEQKGPLLICRNVIPAATFTTNNSLSPLFWDAPRHDEDSWALDTGRWWVQSEINSAAEADNNDTESRDV